MIVKLEQFLLLENIQQAKNILKDKNLDPNNENDYKEILKLLNRLPNLIGKFVYFRYVDNVSMESIEEIIKWIISNRQIINLLPKNIINYNSFENLDDDIQKLNRDQLLKNFITHYIDQ